MLQSPAQLIEDSRRLLRAALDRWQAADFDRITETRELLTQSVTHLAMAIDLLRAGASVVVGDLQPKIVSLRSDITTMMRLVDACSAFQRGLALCEGGVAPAYDSSGKTVADGEAVSLPGLLV